MVTADEGTASGDTPAQTKTKPSASWKANEQHVLPKNNMPFVFSGLMLCLFLAALDQVSISRKFFINLVTYSENSDICLGGFIFDAELFCESFLE